MFVADSRVRRCNAHTQDFAAQRVYFYNNEQLQGFVASTRHLFKEGRLR